MAGAHQRGHARTGADRRAVGHDDEPAAGSRRAENSTVGEGRATYPRGPATGRIRERVEAGDEGETPSTHPAVFAVDPAGLTARRRIRAHPAISMFRLFPEAGGLMAYKPDLPVFFGRNASYVDKILRGKTR